MRTTGASQSRQSFNPLRGKKPLQQGFLGVSRTIIPFQSSTRQKTVATIHPPDGAMSAACFNPLRGKKPLQQFPERGVAACALVSILYEAKNRCNPSLRQSAALISKVSILYEAKNRCNAKHKFKNRHKFLVSILYEAKNRCNCPRE